MSKYAPNTDIMFINYGGLINVGDVVRLICNDGCSFFYKVRYMADIGNFVNSHDNRYPLKYSVVCCSNGEGFEFVSSIHYILGVET